jgi:hypothetical protein
MPSANWAQVETTGWGGCAPRSSVTPDACAVQVSARSWLGPTVQGLGGTGLLLHVQRLSPTLTVVHKGTARLFELFVTILLHC